MARLRMTVLLLASVLVFVGSALAGGLADESDKTGTCSNEQARRTFVEQSCTRCHSVTTQDGSEELLQAARPRGVTPVHKGSERMQPERIEKLLVKRTDGRGMRHPFHWKGTEEGLACLVSWLNADDASGSGESEKPGDR